MTFVNQYIEPRLTLRDAGTFLEEGTPFLYAVGQGDGPAVVLKTTATGGTVWVRELIVGATGVLLFHQVVQLQGSHGLCYAIAASSGRQHYLVGIDSDGLQLWLKEVVTREAEPDAFLVANDKRNGCYFGYSDRSEGDKLVSPKVLRFDADGNLVAARRLKVRDVKYGGFVITAMSAYSDGLAVAASLSVDGTLGCTMGLAEDLTAQVATIYPGLAIQDLLFWTTGSAVSAYSSADESVILIQAILDFFPLEKGVPVPAIEYLIFPESARKKSVLCPRPGGYLLSVLDDARGDLYYVTLELQSPWRKGFAAGGQELGVASMSFERALDRVTFTTGSVSLVGVTDSNFAPCVAYPISRQELERNKLETAYVPLDVEEIRVSIKPVQGTWRQLQPQRIVICAPQGQEPPFQWERDAALQSPHLYLQAAGSLGADSTPGIHLRWLLKGALASHLPKADYAATTANFNKSDDFVRIFRAPYVPRPRALSLLHPQLIAPYEWIYRSGGDVFYLSFLNRARYDQVAPGVDPAADPQGFIAAYGNQPLELEHKTRLAFAVRLVFTPLAAASVVDLELRSVEANTFGAPRTVTLRGRYTPPQLGSKKLFGENIRSIRFRASQAVPAQAFFEFYDDFLGSSLETQAWRFVGRHALTTDDTVAFRRLEPAAGDVHGRWLRYNDGAAVNADNYRKKWSSAALPAEKRLVETVKKYIQLSDDPANPEATELVYFNDPAAPPIPGYGPEPGFDPSDNQLELSNLYLLQVASLDYHLARLLGLGVLDLDPGILTGQHIYLAEYVTLADLGGGGADGRRVQHLYLSLPTALADQRLPLPIELKAPVPGVVFGNDTEAPAVLTDAGGYSHDGHTRYLSLFHQPLPEEPEDAAFFHSSELFVGADHTLPVYAGIEYRQQGAANWVKPELSFDAAWLNVDATVGDGFKQETRSIVIPDPLYPLFVHRERRTGWHDYGSYGINWFSRATPSAVVQSIETVIRPSNLLLPPTNLNATLVVREQPLFLTSAAEQDALADLASAPDKTFIRLTWDYNHGQELIDYHRKIDGEPIAGYAELADAEELFAESIELYFRDSVPNVLGGKILAVAEGPHAVLAVVATGEYVFASLGTDPLTGLPAGSLVPDLPVALEPGFLGSQLVVGGISYPIEAIDNSGTYPVFTVFKVGPDGNAQGFDSVLPPSELSSPPVNGLFSVVENMAVPANWGAGNPQGLVARVEPAAIHREEVEVRKPDGSIDTHVHKFRGVYRNALIEAVPEDHDGDEEDDEPTDSPRVHQGLYKLTFTGFALPQHSQAGGPGHRVELHGGVVRIHTAAAPGGPRKELKVVRTENIGTAADLVLYAADAAFVAGDPAYDVIETGVRAVNYYPSYRAYLYADLPHGLTAANTLPSGDEPLRYTLFGARSHDAELGYFSPMSVPALMFARSVREPLQPRPPVGPLYATRPDFYGKSTFTFTTAFEHAPHGVQYLRASDVQILRALYRPDDGGDPASWTAQRIESELFGNGADPFFGERWQNLVGLDYVYPAHPANNGRFAELPPGGAALPLPNSPKFIASIDAFVDSHNAFYGTAVPHLGTVASLHQVVIPASAHNAELRLVDFLRETLQNCFLPLTEIPILYQHIKGPSYQPISKKQVVRDRNGVLLPSGHPDFDIAPMVKTIGPNETQFTDFNIDGASNAHYFYAVREFSLTMQAGPFSPILGPVHLVNAAPPRPPEVVKVTPILERRNPPVAPAIELCINGYPAVQRIETLEVYRATNGLDARSVRTMKKLPAIDVAATGMAADAIWRIRDDFADLGYVPYGDPLFYVLTVSRAVEYQDRDGVLVHDLVPSESSKTVLTNIVESYNPDPPKLEYYATPVNAEGELEQVTLAWPKKVHNGKYHLYQRNSQGNWNEIAVVQDNAPRVVVALDSTTLGSGTLQVENEDGNPVYHHFKVVSENFAGMISRTEEILTLHQPGLWQDIATL